MSRQSTTQIRFGTDGWRAIIADDFTFANVRVCAQGVASYVNASGQTDRGVVVGYDTRFASDRFADAAAEVIAANGIAAESGLGESFVGASFLAFSTSLPELSTAIAAVRIGAFDLAVGSLLGSNAFNMAIILLVDLVYFDGPILAAVDPVQAFVGVSAILLMSIVLASIVHGARTRVSRLEPSSLMTVVVYLLLMYLIWTAGS